MDFRRSAKAWNWQVVYIFSLCSWGWVFGQLRYSIVEESQPGTVVGNIAQDLGLKASEIYQRRLNLGSEGNKKYFSLNNVNGILTINERIDRESLCGSKLSCVLHIEAVTENPLELFNVEIDILDINDNSPSFLSSNYNISITELLANPGVRFPLELAQDLDVGINGVSQYVLYPNRFFSLSVKNRKDGTYIPQLILEKNLDREEIGEHKLILTAYDGGEPPRSGYCQITVIVLDFNDNAPLFDHPSYKISLKENLPLKSVIIKLNASDLDEGINGEIEYSFDAHTSDSARKVFDLNAQTGEIYIKGNVDYEETSFYELSIKAIDKGEPKLEGNCLIQLEIEDVNDNSPEIIFTSMTKEIPENAAIGTVIGFINVKDRDSGKNGEVQLKLSPDLPFKIKPFKKQYSLVTDEHLDREKHAQYTFKMIASDLGSPSLDTQTDIMLTVLDINDNPPTFSQPTYNAFIKENNDPGSFLCSVTAFDQDEGVNSGLVYSVVDQEIDSSPVSSFVYINPNSGNLYAQRSFDYEHIQVLQITVRAEDSGFPKLYSNASIVIFILDTNDNYPTILLPKHQDLIFEDTIPKSAKFGYLATKVSAVDLDSGHNAWLHFSLIEPVNSSLFGVSAYTGEIRTIRDLQDTDNFGHRLVILVRDHGYPVLSTTVTILLSIEEEMLIEDFKSRDLLDNSSSTSDLTLYLIISLVAISLVSLVTFIILFVKCLRREQYNNSSSCCFLSRSDAKPYSEQYQPTLFLNKDGTLKYMEVRMIPPEPQGQCYQTCFPPTTETCDFTFLQPLNFPNLKDMTNESEPSPNTSYLNDPNQNNMT